MYQAYLNHILFYDDTSAEASLALTSAKLELKAGGAGCFTFSVPPSNVRYDAFHKLTDYVDLYREEELIFSGRVYSEAKEFQGISVITCEGLLALFHDTILRPGTYNLTLQALLEAILASHNQQVEESKQITLGNITVSDDYVYREYETYESTMERLSDLVDSYGGYLSVVKEKRDGDTEEKLYFDWIADITVVAEQEINLGENLLDFSQESAADAMFSVIVPLGKELEDSDGNKAKLTITNVPTDEGWHTIGTDYIEDAAAIAEIGRIVKVVQWEDVTDQTNLYNKAKDYLADQSRSRVTITVSAVDLATSGSAIEAWKIAERVKVNAAIFGVSGAYLEILEQSLDLQNPTNNTLQLGSTAVGYVENSQTGLHEVTKKVDTINQNYTTNANVTNQVQKLAGDLDAKLGTVTSRIEKNEAWINQYPDGIDTTVKSIIEEEVGGRVSTIENSATLHLDAERVNATVEKVIGNGEGAIATWMQFDTNGLTIGRSNSKVKSIQDNDSYEFVDGDSNKVLLEINTDGVEAETVTAKSQWKLRNGSVDQWVIRNGVSDSGHANMDFVWIGGNV